MPRAHQHWLYVWIPLVTAAVWFGEFLINAVMLAQLLTNPVSVNAKFTGTLLAMLITWLAQGRPHYVSQDGSIAYISDVGADILKPLFVTGCSITAAGFFLSLVVERWLRHSGRQVLSKFASPSWISSRVLIVGSQADSPDASPGTCSVDSCNLWVIHRRSWSHLAFSFRHETPFKRTPRLLARLYRRSGPQCHIYRDRGAFNLLDSEILVRGKSGD